tara:strand:+ start:12377 stop:13657 length:1281 start_codon:yes stop_codon:yes gene_type:complete
MQTIYIGYDHFDQRETFHNGAPNDNCAWLQYRGIYLNLDWNQLWLRRERTAPETELVEVDALTFEGKYVYPINAFCSEIALFGDMGHSGGKGMDEKAFFGNFIDAKVLDDLSEGRVLLHINFIHETYRYDDTHMERLHEFLKEFNINPIYVLLSADNHRLQRDYDTWADKNGIGMGEKIQIMETSFGEVGVESYGNSLGTRRVSTDVIKYDFTLNQRRFYFFNTMNTDKSYRIEIADWIELSKLEKKILYSALWKGRRIPEKYHWPYDPDKYGVEPDDITKSNFDVDLNQFHYLKNPYYHAYCEIVTETVFDSSTIQMSEKTFKPLFNLMPFILVGGAGHLERLRSYGYKTFPSIFDESYDLVEDDRQRMQMIKSEIKRICNMPHNTLHNKYYEIIDDLVHNRDVFYQYNEGLRFLPKMIKMIGNL